MTTPTLTPTDTRTSEREPQFMALMALYRPPKTLRKSHKDLLKTAWSIHQGYDGSKLTCLSCRKLGDFGFITVHHKDGIESHNDPDNLAPFCWECNRKEGAIVRLRNKAEAESKERENLSVGIGSEPPHDTATRIIETNEEGEPAFREFVVEHILRYGPQPDASAIPYLKPSEVLNAGSNWAGPNPKTCYPYLGRMTNKINGFIKFKRHPRSKARYLAFRFLSYYDLTAEEILDLNPKEGLSKRLKESSPARVPTEAADA